MGYGLSSTDEQLASIRAASDAPCVFVHIDTCLPSYLQDHHNRDGECLFGVPIDGSMTRGAVRASLVAEVKMSGDRVPEAITDEMIDRAIGDLFDGDLAPIFDSSLDAPPRQEDFEDENGEPDEDAFDAAERAWEDEAGESPQAWFLLTWDVPEEAPSE